MSVKVQAAAAAQAAPAGVSGSIFNLQRAVFEAREEHAAEPVEEAAYPAQESAQQAEAEPEAFAAAAALPAAQIRQLDRETLRQFEVVRRDCPESLLDAMRQLRGRLLRRSAELTGPGEGLRTVLVTSVLPGAGKSFVARNLALMTGVIPDCRVVLAEANLARPTLTARMGLDGQPGVRDSLSGCEWHEMSQRVPGLDVFVAGAGHGLEDEIDPCDSRLVDRFRERVGAHFDWLILDGPSMSESADAEMLSHMADLTVVVMRPGAMHTSDLSRHLGRLDPARVAGVVFNRHR